MQRGLGHYARLSGVETICLYGPETLPHWVNKLGVPQRFEQRRDSALAPLRVYRDGSGALRRFKGEPPISAEELPQFGLLEYKWGTWDWPLIFSSEERAILEMLQDVPDRESIYEAYVLLQGLVNYVRNASSHCCVHAEASRLPGCFLRLRRARSTRGSNISISPASIAARASARYSRAASSILSTRLHCRPILMSMPDNPYYRQLRLLVHILPAVMAEKCFALLKASLGLRA